MSSAFDYDPKVDSRWLPPPGGLEVLPEPDARAENHIAELEAARQEWDKVSAVFDVPGWTILTEVIQSDRDAIERKLIREKDAAEWKYLRGQLAHADWILQLADEVRAKHEKVTEQLRQLTQEQEGAG